MDDSRRGFLAILLGRIGLTLGYVYMAMGIMIGLFPIFTHFHAFSRIFTYFHSLFTHYRGSLA